MDKSRKSKIKNLQKFSKDLFRFNDPTAGWGEGELYCQCLTWGRATITFSGVLVLTGLLGWSYFQLRQEPYQKFLRTCDQQGLDSATCSSHWDNLNSLNVLQSDQ